MSNAESILALRRPISGPLPFAAFAGHNQPPADSFYLSHISLMEKWLIQLLGSNAKRTVSSYSSTQ